MSRRQQRLVRFDRPTTPQIIGILALFLIGTALITGMILRQATAFSSGVLHAKEGRYSLVLEVVSTSRQRRNGLMERDSLAPDAGMLFVYDEEQTADHAFWMYQTRIPLDIAFLDHVGEIQSITSMDPCTTEKGACPRYPAGTSFWMALEVNAGYFNEHGIAAGDRLEIDPLQHHPPLKTCFTVGVREKHVNEHTRFFTSIGANLVGGTTAPVLSAMPPLSSFYLSCH
ncbi:DUF192 domain-containing protein [Halovibrio sp. HP20-59]|jgi:uncharacterized protein|uniref:DUF192 domain-containing protein n=1 Tax=Halomonadaceae TaxID=28256 RepID=UPI001ED4A63B|nr:MULTISPECIES: DUF192 domain-containing protein [Halomonadaceae]MBL1270456.1 DUF192 domain-containing protein [Halomonas sp.]MEA2118887.1 DUF192 domain-containing protein [Halovibrio sp. HP20-59]|tara:strand:- start:117 stop:800 length:684 start_codon:yes stop_codon:yes gene_type:complete